MLLRNKFGFYVQYDSLFCYTPINEKTLGQETTHNLSDSHFETIPDLTVSCSFVFKSEMLKKEMCGYYLK